MKKIKKMSFTYKLLVVFILVALVPVLIIMMLFYQMMANILQDKTNDYLRNISNVTISKLEDSIIYVEDTGFFVAGNEEIQDMLILEKNATLNQIEKYKQYQAIKQALAIHSVVKQEIISMFIESSKGSRYNYSKGNSYFDFSKLEMENTFESGKWSVIDSKIYYYKSIHTYLEEGCLGKLAIEVEPMVFYEIIKDIDYSSSGEVYLINNDGIIIASKDAKATGQELESVYKNLEIKSDVIYPNVMIEESSYTVYVSEEISNGWSLLLSIPTKYYINDIIRVQQQTIIMLICSSIIIVLLIIYTANQVTRPIKKLSQAMMEIGQGNLDVSCTVETEDEIGILSQSFNQMVEDMKHLIKSEFEQKVMSQGAEMKSLQMQINPHFLYNTLDTINWMARMQGLDDVGDITSSLGELMRYSLSKNEFVSCKEEIENLRNYVSIQDVRYGDKMSVVFELEEGVGYYYIPKLLIQPILENAIVHGVEEKLEESIITVRIFTKGEELFVIVEDDGVGMDQQAIESLLYDHVQVKQGHTSIGVKNVNRRIKMVFGEECGIQIQSVLGAGTKITLRMKKLKEPIDMVMNYIES